MSGRIDAKLKELKLTIPNVAPPAVANYVPWVRTGNLIYISGQIAMGAKGPLFGGKVGEKVTLEQAQKAAQLCAINIIAVLKTALDGDLDRVKRCVKLNGYVNSTPGFTQHPEVLNGASNVLVRVFGDAGKHARAAVGVPSLPRDVSVEIDGVFEVE
jgi:enamine deaminase RidA (YjgF/YER057c/UK114 family)